MTPLHAVGAAAVQTGIQIVLACAMFAGIFESLILESKVTTAAYNTDFKQFGGDFSQTL